MDAFHRGEIASKQINKKTFTMSDLMFYEEKYGRVGGDRVMAWGC